ncbi:MAG: DoxX family protein [Pseudomonadota bacterium]|uniref:DoxX family protein n=1 Tax=Sphingomonas sp. ERG5 TaxID=1381597 RepID=UPI00054B1138|nr:DoxX family protein [Sphingomonas sp. ERG5]
MTRYPFIPLPLAVMIARIMTAVFFLAYAVVRIANGTIPRFGTFVEAAGFPYGIQLVWLITLSELVCGALLILGLYVCWATIPLFVIAGMGIVIIHRHAGRFVGEHGTGGSEYRVALLVLLLVVAASDRPPSVIPVRNGG